MWLLLLISLGAQTLAVPDFAYNLTTDHLPSNLKYMPTLGNGHLGYTVFGDAILLNGVYNGKESESHRARIPNWLNVSVSSLSADIAVGQTNVSYEMLLEDGYFRWVQTSKDAGLVIEQRSYAHRYYTRALVYELLMWRRDATKNSTVTLQLDPGLPSTDFNFAILRNAKNIFKGLRGATKDVEFELFQRQKRAVYVFFSDNFDTKQTLHLPEGQHELRFRFVLTIDTSSAVAQREMEDILGVTAEQMFQQHISEWHAFWHNQFNITVKGNLEMSQTINAALFYLVSCLRSPHSNQPHDAHHGLSPTGLGRGYSAIDYRGHNFWDTEIWMLPVVERISEEWSSSVLKYRLQHSMGAVFNADETGYKGARFPWESAYTGIEVTDVLYAIIAEEQVHISADIVHALELHYAGHHDEVWLCADARALTDPIATFLASRVSWDNATQQYHVEGVVGPDEFVHDVDDNVFTNVVFQKALLFASFVREVCANAKEDKQAEEWRKIAQNMFILYDAVTDYHPQYVGFQISEGHIKQADTILIAYPLLFPMNTSTLRNDVHIYAGLVAPEGPAMTWSMFAISSLDLLEVAEANSYFNRSYKNYVMPQFKVWTETGTEYLNGSAVNFLTGAGGFLQALINGFAGIRLRRENSTSIMDIKKRNLPTGITDLSIKGLKFANASFSLDIGADGHTNFTCQDMGKLAMALQVGKVKHTISKGLKVELHLEEATLRTL